MESGQQLKSLPFINCGRTYLLGAFAKFLNNSFGQSRYFNRRVHIRNLSINQSDSVLFSVAGDGRIRLRKRRNGNGKSSRNPEIYSPPARGGVAAASADGVAGGDRILFLSFLKWHSRQKSYSTESYLRWAATRNPMLLLRSACLAELLTADRELDAQLS